MCSDAHSINLNIHVTNIFCRLMESQLGSYLKGRVIALVLQLSGYFQTKQS